MNAEQAAVVSVVHLLVEREYAGLESMTHAGRLSASDLRGAVEAYGRTFVELPAEALEDLDIVQIEGMEPSTFSVVVDLWTAEEGRNDLALELRLIDPFSSVHEIEIMDLHPL